MTTRGSSLAVTALVVCIGLAGAEGLADLSAQYLVTYALPDGVEPSGRLEVTLNRPTATLRAPIRVAR